MHDFYDIFMLFIHYCFFFLSGKVECGYKTNEKSKRISIVNLHQQIAKNMNEDDTVCLLKT